MTSTQTEIHIPEHSLDRDCTTLSRHVLQQLQSFSPDAQDLSSIMNRIALAGKLIARRLSRAGLMTGALGLTGDTNVQGESVKKNGHVRQRSIYFRLQAKWLSVSSCLRRNGKTLLYPRKLSCRTIYPII